MRRFFPVCILLVLLMTVSMSRADAQCSICTRTAQQLGERPAKALNKGIIYLAFAPLAIFGILGLRWWRSQGPEEFSSGDNR